MIDGAHQGISAERALETILGGKPAPQQDEQMSDAAFEAWVRCCPEDVHGYGDTARLAARYLVEFLETHPGARTKPLDNVYDWELIGGFDWKREKEALVQSGVWSEACAYRPALKKLDLSGFMAGWAWNAARKVLGLGPHPNPALFTISLP